MKHSMIVATLALSVLISAGYTLTAQGGGRAGQPPSPYPITQGKTFRFEKIVDGVYYATGGNGGNSPVIIGARDVLVVDTGTTPASARAFIEDLKLVTDKPVRYVVNSHFHYDHTDGNQVYAGKADIIGHEYVKYAMENYDILHIEPYMTSQAVNGPNRIDNLKRQITEERDAGKKATLETQLATAQRNFDDLKEIKITPPNVTYKDKKVIDLGGREVDLLFLGRGHTNGDTVVYLPKEKIACTGDLMEYGPAYMGNGQFEEWDVTLEKLKKLGYELDLPGHGIPFKDVAPGSPRSRVT